MQREEHADWVLEDLQRGIRIALEVSGVDKGSISARITEKLSQVAKCSSAEIDQRWAGIPRSRLGVDSHKLRDGRGNCARRPCDKAATAFGTAPRPVRRASARLARNGGQ
jgi:hypothetical protein